MSNYKVKEVCWHEAHAYKCKHSSHCNYTCCHNNCQYKNEDTIILGYVYKQQVNYLICENNKKYAWYPFSSNNGSIYLDYTNKTYMSASLVYNIGSISPINLTQNEVVYPDYSNVDVGQGIKWPNKVFSPYVDSTAWPPLKFADIYPNIKVPFFNLGFIVSQSPTVFYPSWGGYYPAQSGPLNDQIKAIRALGGDVTVSFGGAANVPLHVTAPDSESLKEQYKRFVLAYGLTRIDFDLEGIWIDVAYNSANIKNSQALKILQDELSAIGKYIDIYFTLPILPKGLTGDGLNILSLALNAGVNIAGVNAMTMDYGDSAVPNPQGQMGQYGIQAITSLKNQLNTLYKGSKTSEELWSMIGTTPMIGVNDVQNEIFGISDANETLNFSLTNSIGMISMWSLNRDNSQQSHISQSDYQFSFIFNKYNG